MPKNPIDGWELERAGIANKSIAERIRAIKIKRITMAIFFLFIGNYNDVYKEPSI
jgi:hypothetical protein